MTLFAEQRPTVGLGLYSLFARTVPLSYRNKIMLVAFLSRISHCWHSSPGTRW